MSNSRDHQLFNCSEDYEHDYIVNQYKTEDRDRVRKFLKQACESEKISNNTHTDVIHLISLEGIQKD